ncbi:hypothetical protein HPB50_003097 [Hyalomma asiaticum]|uniref:Uncharacterized protein n=1 Tax=Hyalomma asiaticum TaxID=266040 RepID=A0ACB7RIL0_HYAAI|nr:hypothetical protein HPB50_003097 [Hyalomma asiaticum]
MANPGVLLRRCPCGQVVNTNGSSQSSGWVTRREVSVQCCLQEMPLLPLPPANSQSVTTADDAEKGLSLPGDTRLSHVLSLFEKELTGELARI